MKPGANFEPAYKLMAEYKVREDDCERLNGEWPGALHHDDGIMIVHGTYKQMFDL